MAGWVGVQGQVNLGKKAKTCPDCDVTRKRYKTEMDNFLKSKQEVFLNPLMDWTTIKLYRSGSYDQARTQEGMQGMHLPHQTERGINMTLDFIENHRQNIFVLHITR